MITCYLRLKILDDYNGVIHSDQIIGTVTQTFSALALRNGWKLIYVYED